MYFILICSLQDAPHNIMLKGKSLLFQISLPPMVNRTNKQSKAAKQNFCDLNTFVPPLLIALDTIAIFLITSRAVQMPVFSVDVALAPGNPQIPRNQSLNGIVQW